MGGARERRARWRPSPLPFPAAHALARGDRVDDRCVELHEPLLGALDREDVDVRRERVARGHVRAPRVREEERALRDNLERLRGRERERRVERRARVSVRRDERRVAVTPADHRLPQHGRQAVLDERGGELRDLRELRAPPARGRLDRRARQAAVDELFERVQRLVAERDVARLDVEAQPLQQRRAADLGRRAHGLRAGAHGDDRAGRGLRVGPARCGRRLERRADHDDECRVDRVERGEEHAQHAHRTARDRHAPARRERARKRDEQRRVVEQPPNERLVVRVRRAVLAEQHAQRGGSRARAGALSERVGAGLRGRRAHALIDDVDEAAEQRREGEALAVGEREERRDVPHDEQRARGGREVDGRCAPHDEPRALEQRGAQFGREQLEFRGVVAAVALVVVVEAVDAVVRVPAQHGEEVEQRAQRAERVLAQLAGGERAQRVQLARVRGQQRERELREAPRPRGDGARCRLTRVLAQKRGRLGVALGEGGEAAHGRANLGRTPARIARRGRGRLREERVEQLKEVGKEEQLLRLE